MPRDEVAGMTGHLLRLREVVSGIAVEGQLTDELCRDQFFRHDLGRIEEVDAFIAVGAIVGHDLNAEFVFEVGASLDAVGHVAAVEVGVAARGDLRLLPHQRMHAGDWLPVKPHQAGLAFAVDHAERMDAETLHGAVGPGDSSITHVPEDVVGGFGVQRHEIPERVVGGLRLRNLAVRMGLAGMNDVGEFDAVLNEEHRDVVANQVEVAFVGVELDSKAAGVAHRVGRPTRTQNGREAAEPFSLLAFPPQETRLGDRCGFSVGLDNTVRGGAPRVHDTLRDALVVEMRDLLPQVKVLKKGRPAITCLE
jgi:hypothetical protein